MEMVIHYPMILGGLLAGVPLASAATYHVDPRSGAIENPGTAEAPWNTLEAIFAANKSFMGGDVILLRSGYHGAPDVRGVNSQTVTIRAEPGAEPRVRKLAVRSAANWIIAGLDISPENFSPAIYGGTLVDIQSTANSITLRDCVIRFSAEPASWTIAEWQSRAGTAIASRAPGTTIKGNRLANVGFGIVLNKTATGSLVSGNLITGFSMDGIRALANSCIYEGNTITNSFVFDSNHDDFFQSWSTDSSGTVGLGTVRDVAVRGNFFISNTAAGQPLAKPPQGVGCFDGMFENWVIENNVIISQTYHGIALYGAVNCRIMNNTVAENAVNGFTTVKPWVRIYEHKNQEDGTPWPVLSSGNVIRNNISAASVTMPATSGVRDHNLVTTAYSSCFVNHAAFDFYPADGSPAIAAGDSAGAPAADIAGHARAAPADLGAFGFLKGARPAGLSDPAVGEENGLRVISMKVSGLPSTKYVVETSTDLGLWNDASPELRPDASVIGWTMAETPGVTRRFFRLVPRP